MLQIFATDLGMFYEKYYGKEGVFLPYKFLTSGHHCVILLLIKWITVQLFT